MRSEQTPGVTDQDDYGETLAQRLIFSYTTQSKHEADTANYAHDEKMTDAETLWHVQKQYRWNMLKLEKMLAKQLRQPRFDLPKKWR